MDNLNQWVEWSIKFKISTTDGYVKLFRNGVQLAELDGNVAFGNSVYFKVGIYTQCEVRKYTEMYLKNLTLVSL